MCVCVRVTDREREKGGRRTHAFAKGRAFSSPLPQGLQAGENEIFLLKCIQYSELLDVRHSVFILGPAGAGKTCLWRNVIVTLALLGDKVTTEILNPKAVTTDELYGYMHEATREWKDGCVQDRWWRGVERACAHARTDVCCWAGGRGGGAGGNVEGCVEPCVCPWEDLCKISTRVNYSTRSQPCSQPAVSTISIACQHPLSCSCSSGA